MSPRPARRAGRHDPTEPSGPLKERSHSPEDPPAPLGHTATAASRSNPLSAPDYRALFEHLPGLYLVLTPDLTICAASNAYLRATGTRREDILGRPVFEVFPDNPAIAGADGAQNVRSSLERVLRERVPDAMAVQKHDIRRPDGEGGGFEERHWRPVNSPVLAADGSVEYLVHRIEDVTELVRLKRQGNAMLDAVVEGVDDAVFVKDDEGRYLLVNAAAAERLDRGIGDVLGRTDAELLPAAQAHDVRATDLIVMADGNKGHFEETLETPMGARIFATQKAPYRAPDGAVRGVVGIARDVTETARRQRQLEEQGATLARLNAGLEQFAAKCSQDLGEPLRGLASHVQGIEDNTADQLDPYLQGHVRRVLESARRLRAKLDRILEFSQAGQGPPATTPCDSMQALRAALASLAPAIGQSGASVTYGELPEVFFTEAQLARVFVNLLSNAITFRTQHSRVSIAAERAGEGWIFAVSDNGPGIPVHLRERAFEMFQRLHEHDELPGEGCGLAISRRIVERHGGRIWIEGAPQQGATVRFSARGVLRESGSF